MHAGLTAQALSGEVITAHSLESQKGAEQESNSALCVARAENTGICHGCHAAGEFTDDKKTGALVSFYPPHLQLRLGRIRS